MKHTLLLLTTLALAYTAQAQPNPQQQEYRKAFNELRMQDEYKAQRQQLGAIGQEVKKLQQAGDGAAAAEKQKEAGKLRRELDTAINAKLKTQRPDLAAYIDSLDKKQGPKPGAKPGAAAQNQPPPPPPAPGPQDHKAKKKKKHDQAGPEQKPKKKQSPAATSLPPPPKPAAAAQPAPAPAPVAPKEPAGPFVKFPDDLKLTDGTTLKKVTVLERTATQVVLSHSKSRKQTVARKDLTPESLKALGY